MKSHSLKTIDILKIDIEGAETELFLEYPIIDQILINTKVVIIEIHDEFNIREKIYAVLKKNRFIIHEDL